MKVWPERVQVILALHNNSNIWVYQAYSPEIAQFAATNKRLLGAPGFSINRMSWIKTNFLWMQFRSGWCSKKNQERCIAIQLRRSFFDDLLSAAVDSQCSDISAIQASDVRLQWDPEHDPSGAKCERRAIQLGLRRDALLLMASGHPILDVIDITDLIVSQREMSQSPDQWCQLQIPVERSYEPQDPQDLLSSSVPSPPKQAAIYLGGEFNPVCIDHVSLIHKVKRFLEHEIGGWNIINGYFVPIPQNQMKCKPPPNRIKEIHRLEMCRIALSDSPWLHCSDKPRGSAIEHSHYTKALFSVVVVCGDRAVVGGRPKWLRRTKQQKFLPVATVCVRRDGKRCEENYQTYLKDCRERPDRIDPYFYFLDCDVASIWSADVMAPVSRAIETGKFGSLGELVGDRVLHPDVSAYIETHLNNLFE